MKFHFPKVYQRKRSKTKMRFQQKDENLHLTNLVELSNENPVPEISSNKQLEQEIQGMDTELTPVAQHLVKSKKKCKKTGQKMHALSLIFSPVAFVPQVADLLKYEEGLRMLGLWDFVHVEFDKDLRVDFVMEMVVNYDVNVRGSYVDGWKIGVSRSDIARALKLPVKKPVEDCEVGSFSEEFVRFMQEEFVPKWVVLYEDFECMPCEVAKWMILIMEGEPHKVDWAGWIWYMMEAELAQRSALSWCYYASHLQLLIKDQKGALLEESSKVENEKVVDMAVEGDGDIGCVQMLNFEQCSLEGHKFEEEAGEFELGQDSVTEVENGGDANMVEFAKKDTDAEKVEDVDQGGHENSVGNTWSGDETHNVENIESGDNAAVVENSEGEEGNGDADMMDFGDCRGEEQRHWPLNGRDDGGLLILQGCSMADAKVSDENRTADGVCEDVEDEEVEEGGHVHGFNIMQKAPSEGMSSANHMQAFETGYWKCTSAEFGGQSSLELMSSRPETNINLGGPSMSNYVCKRETDYEHDDVNHKRMRLDGPWDHKTPDIDMCIEQMMHWAGKAKISHDAAKQEAYQQVTSRTQLHPLQVAEKDREIVQLRYKLKELQRRRVADINCRDKELYLMSSVIDGYKKALKHTQRVFAEYRKLCQVPDEPIYRDTGSGGVMKSIMCLERERIMQEEYQKMIRCMIKKTFHKHLNAYDLKWEELHVKVLSLETRLMDAAKEVNLLKNDLLKRKISADVKV